MPPTVLTKEEDLLEIVDDEEDFNYDDEDFEDYDEDFEDDDDMDEDEDEEEDDEDDDSESEDEPVNEKKMDSGNYDMGPTSQSMKKKRYSVYCVSLNFTNIFSKGSLKSWRQ